MSPNGDGPAAGVGARGVILLVVAVGLGALLLQAFDSGSVPFTDIPNDTVATLPEQTTVPDLPDQTTTSTAPARAPAQVAVLAANGTATAGLAGRVSQFLTGGGYTNALTPTDAAQKPVETSRVEHKAGLVREARQIAQLLGLATTAVREVTTFSAVIADSSGADVLVMIGPDLDRPLAG